ncbi:MAG TPA: DNA repair protein RecN [Bryobacteraceae bacterium]|nr:DNA repair protein RecN [Bryobacteraceae bacterium]
MLLELVVENYAVVERVRVRFHPGLNLLTGETGSGKSIVVDALGLLFGGRASADMVRSDTDRARISGIFEAPQDPACRALLDEAGVPLEDGELLMEREVLAGGKSRAFLGNRPVTAALLRTLAPYLGDIHGQHDQQQLFSADAQLELLDQFADLEEAVERVAVLFREWKRIQDELSDLEKSEQEKLRLADLWSFQRKEIEAAGLKADEDSQLENERLVLKNVAKLQESANAGYSALYDAPESASSQIRIAVKKLEELCRIDGSLQGALEILRSAEIGVGEASRAVRDYLDRLEADPDRLEHVESRLALIDRLKRKYGASLAEVSAFLDNVRAQIEAVETAGERKAKLEQDLASASEAYREAAGALSKSRGAAAQKLAKKVEGELGSLAVENAVFRIEIQPGVWSERGADRVEFLISANVGEEPRPLDKVASGGELSRIALALKTSVGITGAPVGRKNRTQRTLVFDEIDSGIGGGVAEAVGRRLKKLSVASQVLCVTHLAQVAGFADHHYFVEKREVKGRTIAEIEELQGEARTREIGRMLSGQRVTAEALKHAEHLIRLGAESGR